MSGEERRRGEGQRRTAGIVIIGDEILKGQVEERNSHYLCKELYSIGVKVGSISVVGDGLEEIATQVRDFSNKFDIVLTTGGIGPTHDDMTYIGVAKAFGDEIVINQVMADMIEKWLGHKGYSRDVIMRMAQMPQSANLLFDPVGASPISSFPIVGVRNVYVFPGVPSFLKKLFPRLLRVIGKDEAFHNRVIYVARDELSITPVLDLAVEKFKQTVVFGSYPVIGNLYYFTRLTMEATKKEEADAANDFLTSNLPNGSVVTGYDEDPIGSVVEKVRAITRDETHRLHVPVKTAIEKIEEALNKYGLKGICICFNGGKDCTALLHLAYAVIKEKFPESKEKLQALCIATEPEPFQEMEDFINASVERYKLKILRYEGTIELGLKAALEENSEIKGVLMGTRSSDPGGKDLTYFQITDPHWPQVMRISPLLDWTYENVWDFLRSLSLPYCSLYDRGYTSIGSRKNTLPNQELKDVDGHFRPAYTLNDSTLERNGREK